MIPRAHFEASCDMRNLHGLVLNKHSPVGQMVRSHIRALVAAAGALEESDVEAMGRGSARFWRRPSLARPTVLRAMSAPLRM